MLASCITKFYLHAVRRVAPTFSIPPPAVSEVRSGGSLNLTCVAVGSPMPYVKWKKGPSTDLTPDDNLPVGRNVLILTNVKESANYTCTAASDLGIIEVTTMVKVQGSYGMVSSCRIIAKYYRFVSYRVLYRGVSHRTLSYRIVLYRIVPRWIEIARKSSEIALATYRATLRKTINHSIAVCDCVSTRYTTNRDATVSMTNQSAYASRSKTEDNVLCGNRRYARRSDCHRLFQKVGIKPQKRVAIFVKKEKKIIVTNSRSNITSLPVIWKSIIYLFITIKYILLSLSLRTSLMQLRGT